MYPHGRKTPYKRFMAVVCGERVLVRGVGEREEKIRKREAKSSKQSVRQEENQGLKMGGSFFFVTAKFFFGGGTTE